MYIVAIAWIYVVSMMAITESSVIGGLITFLSYGVIPLGVVWFIAKRVKRRFTQPQGQNSSKNDGKKK
jgi:hypothetical protein